MSGIAILRAVGAEMVGPPVIAKACGVQGRTNSHLEAIGLGGRFIDDQLLLAPTSRCRLHNQGMGLVMLSG